MTSWVDALFPYGPPFWHRLLLIYSLSIAGMLWSELAFWSATEVAWPHTSSTFVRFTQQLAVAGGYAAGTVIAMEVIEAYGSLILKLSPYRSNPGSASSRQFPRNVRAVAGHAPDASITVSMGTALPDRGRADGDKCNPPEPGSPEAIRSAERAGEHDPARAPALAVEEASAIEVASLAGGGNPRGTSNPLGYTSNYAPQSSFQWTARGTLIVAMCAGALYGWQAEGALVGTVYEALPFSIVSTGIQWHMLVSILLGWVLASAMLAHPSGGLVASRCCACCHCCWSQCDDGPGVPGDFQWQTCGADVMSEAYRHPRLLVATAKAGHALAPDRSSPTPTMGAAQSGSAALGGDEDRPLLDDTEESPQADSERILGPSTADVHPREVLLALASTGRAGGWSLPGVACTALQWVLLGMLWGSWAPQWFQDTGPPGESSSISNSGSLSESLLLGSRIGGSGSWELVETGSGSAVRGASLGNSSAGGEDTYDVHPNLSAALQFNAFAVLIPMVLMHAAIGALLACAADPIRFVPSWCIARSISASGQEAPEEHCTAALWRCTVQFSQKRYTRDSEAGVASDGEQQQAAASGSLDGARARAAASQAASTTSVTIVSAFTPSLVERLIWYLYIAALIVLQGIATGGIAIVVWPAIVGFAVWVASTEGSRRTFAAGACACCLGGYCGCGPTGAQGGMWEPGTTRRSHSDRREASHPGASNGGAFSAGGRSAAPPEADPSQVQQEVQQGHSYHGQDRGQDQAQNEEAEIGGLFVLLHGWIDVVAAVVGSTGGVVATGSDQGSDRGDRVLAAPGSSRAPKTSQRYSCAYLWIDRGLAAALCLVCYLGGAAITYHACQNVWADARENDEAENCRPFTTGTLYIALDVFAGCLFFLGAISACARRWSCC